MGQLLNQILGHTLLPILWNQLYHICAWKESWFCKMLSCISHIWSLCFPLHCCFQPREHVGRLFLPSCTNFLLCRSQPWTHGEYLFPFNGKKRGGGLVAINMLEPSTLLLLGITCVSWGHRFSFPAQLLIARSHCPRELGETCWLYATDKVLIQNSKVRIDSYIVLYMTM